MALKYLYHYSIPNKIVWLYLYICSLKSLSKLVLLLICYISIIYNTHHCNPFILLVLLLKRRFDKINCPFLQNSFVKLFFQDHYPWTFEDPFIHLLKVSSIQNLFLNYIWTSRLDLNGLSNTYPSWAPSLLRRSA